MAPIVTTLETGDVLFTVKSENSASDGPLPFMHVTVQLMDEPTRTRAFAEQLITEATVGYDKIAIENGLPPEMIALLAVNFSVMRNDVRSKFGAVIEKANLAPLLTVCNDGLPDPPDVYVGSTKSAASATSTPPTPATVTVHDMSSSIRT